MEKDFCHRFRFYNNTFIAVHWRFLIFLIKPCLPNKGTPIDLRSAFKNFMSDLRTYLESTLTIVLLNYFAKFFRLSFTSCIISFAIAGNLLRSCQKKLMLTKQMLEVPVRDWLVLSLSFSTLNLTLSVRYSPSNLWFKIIEYFFAIVQK